jgi:hypothetical protein
MGNVATRVTQTQSLPDPTYLWLRAQLEKRAEKARAVPRSRIVALALASLVVGLLAAVAVLAALPTVSARLTAAGSWLFATLAETSPALIVLIGTSALGLPCLLGATYLLVLRPSR